MSYADKPACETVLASMKGFIIREARRIANSRPQTRQDWEDLAQVGIAKVLKEFYRWDHKRASALTYFGKAIVKAMYRAWWQDQLIRRPTTVESQRTPGQRKAIERLAKGRLVPADRYEEYLPVFDDVRTDMLEEWEHVTSSISTLPEPYRVPLVMLLQGRRRVEIAEYLGMTRFGATLRIRSAIERLREKLAERGVG